jgi:hypothetical protein
MINSIIYLLNVIELACLRRVSKQFCQIIPSSLVMNNGNDDKVSIQERTLVLRRIALCNDWVNIIESCKRLEHLHIGDHCNWNNFYLHLEKLICLQRLCMTVNAFNSKGAFYIIGHKLPSYLGGFHDGYSQH